MGQIIRKRADLGFDGQIEYCCTVIGRDGDVVEVCFVARKVEEKWTTDILLDEMFFCNVVFDKLEDFRDYVGRFCKEYM